jgi:quercetin dioxygenase-like cupin family protein
MKIKTQGGGLASVVAVGVVLLGVTAYASVTQMLAVGVIPHSELFGGPAEVTVRTLTIKPGEVLPWHYHPGYAFNVVKSGTLTVEDGCGGPDETLRPGDAFEELEGHVHRAKNLSATEDLVIYNTFIVPKGKPTTINLDGRRCGPPGDVDQCKGDGWAKFTHPRRFGNRTDCVRYVRRRPRLALHVPEDPGP